MIDSSKIKDILEELGYKLSDKGGYWQCSALYRGGDNQTALQIYKDTGAWKDYVKDTSFMPFKRLLVLTLNTNDPKELSKYLNKDEVFLLNTDYLEKDESNNKKENIDIIKNLKDNWKLLDKDEKEAVWKYLQVLIKLTDKYLSETLKLN